MDMKKVLTKYVILLLVYIVIVRFIEPYGLQIYYSTIENPIDNPNTIQTIQSFMTLITFIINLIFMIFMIVDTKAKKLLDWLIIVITFFSPEAGITIFIVWQIYKQMMIKYEAQQKI
jgi:heme A synthase